MSGRPTFAAPLLGTVRAPARFDRAGRVKLIGEAAQALLAGRLPGRESALFLGGALLAWLESGGDLERDFLQVVKPKSHHTPDVIWRLIADEGQATEGDGTLAPSSPESECRK